MKSMKRVLATIVLIAVIAAPVFGDGIPRVISYQARLTDSTGVAYANGDVILNFTIYDDVGTQMWSSGKQTVGVENGLFEYHLGSSTPFPDNLFDEEAVLWLGIEIDDSGELLPRVQLLSSPFAFHALRADTALILDVDTLDVGSLQRSGVINLVGNTHGDEDVCVRIREADLGGGRIDIFHPGSEATGSAVQLSADNDSSGGTLMLAGEPLSGMTVVLEGSRYTNQEPYFSMHGSDKDFRVDLNVADGDSAVRLPESAVSSVEMDNEAGIGHSERTDAVYFTNEAYSTILHRPMVFPSDGYAVVVATAMFSNSHNDSRSSSYDFGISTSSTSLEEVNAFRWYREASSPEVLTHDPITVHACFEVNAGYNTFYFLAYTHSLGTYAVAYRAQMSVMFYPTNYEFNISPQKEE